MSELELLKQEAEQLKTQIRVSVLWVKQFLKPNQHNSWLIVRKTVS